MGHKAVTIFDLDHLDNMEKDPAEFVRRLKNAILTHRRLGGSVSIDGATVASIVWSGHVDNSPVLKFVDFKVENVTYGSAKVRTRIAKEELPYVHPFGWSA